MSTQPGNNLRRRHLHKCLLILGALLGFCLPAHATLIGDTVTVTTEANFPTDTWTDSVLVTSGIELDGSDTTSTLQHVNPTQGQNYAALYAGDYIDIGADSITIHYAALGEFGFNYAFIIYFSDLDWTDSPGTLTGVSLASGASGLNSGWQISSLSADAFTFQGTVDLVTGANFTLNLAVTHDQVSDVPEPMSLYLLGLGLLFLAFTSAPLRRPIAIWISNQRRKSL